MPGTEQVSTTEPAGATARPDRSLVGRKPDQALQRGQLPIGGDGAAHSGSPGEGGDECGEIGRISREQWQSESGRTRRCAAGTHAARAPEGAGDVVGASGDDRPADRGSSSRTG